MRSVKEGRVFLLPGCVDGVAHSGFIDVESEVEENFYSTGEEVGVSIALFF